MTAKQGRNVAERAALVYVGATLEARDRALALVGDLRDDDVPQGRREADLQARAPRPHRAQQLERDVRKARTRLERELRGRRRDAERMVSRNRADIEREADRRRTSSPAGRARRDVVQAVVAAGERLATTAKERVTSIA